MQQEIKTLNFRINVIIFPFVLGSSMAQRGASDNKRVNTYKNKTKKEYIRILASKEWRDEPKQREQHLQRPRDGKVLRIVQSLQESGCCWTMINGQSQLCRAEWPQERTWSRILSAVRNHSKVLSTEVTYFCFLKYHSG